MRRIETNDFPILNLAELTAQYKLFKIRGLQRSNALYFANIKHVIRKLASLLQKPVTMIEIEKVPHLVVRADAGLMPTSLGVVKGTVYFDQVGDEFTLDFAVRDPEYDKICQKFLQFAIQERLYNHPKLWQPKAGAPFFMFNPDIVERGIAHHIGFSFRVVTRGGGLAVRIHVANKYVGPQPFPAILDANEFERLRGRSIIYHFGHRWYEARAETLADLNVVDYTIPDDGVEISLIDYVAKHSKKPVPPELSGIPAEGSVIGYRSNRGEDRAMPAGLCYPVFSARDTGMGGLHKRSLLPPWERRKKTRGYISEFFSRLRFGDAELRIDTESLKAVGTMFVMPDLQFGNFKKLSVRGTPGATNVPLEQFGKARLALLKDRRAGFYEFERLGRQYLVLPQSVVDSYGDRFVDDLKSAMDELYPLEDGYDPEIIAYNDRTKKTLGHQGNAIREALAAYNPSAAGHGIVMVHRVKKRKPTDEDELAAMAVRELDKYDIRGAAIHTDTTGASYVIRRDSEGSPRYTRRQDRQGGVLRGYLQNVALNKILLTNERWAFVLGTRLNADLIVGIDVKNNFAGVTAIGSNGEKISSFCRESKQKEQLTAAQICCWLKAIIEKEVSLRQKKGLAKLCRITLHRDGRIWETEVEGADRAMDDLKRVGVLSEDSSLTIVEIPKNPMTPLRFFDVTDEEKDRSFSTLNPEIGLYDVLDENEGFVCTTGRAFPRRGTVEPLCVKKICGELSIEQCLQDVFYLSALALTKPDDCSRYPLSIKLNDRALSDAATEFNEDELEYAGSEENEEDEYDDTDSDIFWDVRRIA